VIDVGCFDHLCFLNSSRIAVTRSINRSVAICGGLPVIFSSSRSKAARASFTDVIY
jgi:hypothetical protein